VPTRKAGKPQKSRAGSGSPPYGSR
jgi:hypothetical protein